MAARTSAPGVDVSRTVGWFTTMYPVCLPLGERDLSRHIQQTKETLRKIPKKGIGYGVLRHLSALSPEQRQQLDYTPLLNFNYLGNMGGSVAGSMFHYTFSGAGERRSPHGELICPLDIQCLLSKGVLHVKLTHDPRRWSPEAVAALGARFVDALRTIADHCASRTHSLHTPSDFELAEVDQDDLEYLMRSY